MSSYFRLLCFVYSWWSLVLAVDCGRRYAGVYDFHSLLECLNLAIQAFLRATFAFAMHTLFGCPSCLCGFFFSFTFLLASMDKTMGLGPYALCGVRKKIGFSYDIAVT